MFGGILKNRSLSNDLWFYNTTSHSWKLLHHEGKFKPPPLTRHTMTLVNSTWLYIFGGSLQYGEFSSDMFRINLDAPHLQWEKVDVLGGKEVDVRLVGHTTVYHEPSHSLLVYGGIAVDIARFSRLSSRLFMFSLSHQYWSEIKYPTQPGKNIILERAFHTANIIGK